MNAVPLNPVHFLLVDDLEENLLSLEALLRREDLIILKARSGPEALEMLLKYDVGLAFLDIQMPGMDGFELAELMRGTERTRRVPIIFLTAGAADRQRRFRGYEAGAVDFLHKPIEVDILKSKADVFFELERQQRLLEWQRDQLKEKADENLRLLEESRRYAEALKETDRRKDEFLATLAHELRNPLAPVRNGIQILRMTPKEEVAEKVRDMMDRQVTHLVRLIDDLLDVSRVSAGKINLQKEQVTARVVIDAAIEAVQPLLEARQQKFELRLPDEDLWLNADLTRISQVLSNILNNAVKYTQVGGHISLEVKSDQGRAIISVRDDGLGIPQDMLSKVFELFTQVNNGLERSEGGLGIGLALARRLVEMHGGRINAESAGLGKGSLFSISLPLLLTAKKEDSMEPAEKTQTAEPLRVLVVDDNTSSAQTLGWMLEFAGHTATLAYDGVEAMNAARAQHPDVILLDIGMPGMNGYDVCKELRKDPQFKDVVFIAQTGWGQQRDLDAATEAGFDHHLLKPVKFEKFSELMSEIQKTRLGA